nr:hypothetical protein [Tanacetum cinerariifolium]
MEDTMLELVKICQEKEFLCIHDNVDDLIESALNTKFLLINSQRLDNKEQEVKSVVEQPVERGNRKPEHPLSMGYEHLSITPETKSDEVTESNAKNLLPIPSECEITSEDKRDCDNLLPIPSECEITSEDKRDCDVPVFTIDVCDDHYDIFSDSKIDDDILVYDNDFEDIQYVEALLSDPEIVSVEEENDDHTEETRSGNTTHADNSLPEYDSFCFEIELDQERLINLVKNDIYDDSSIEPLLKEADLFLASDNSIPPGIENIADDSEGDNDIYDDSSIEPLLKEADLFLASDNSIPPGIENIADDSEGDVRFLDELLIDDSILSHESSDSNFEDNPSIPRPPLEPPGAKTDA